MTPKRRLCSQCHLAINNCICQHAIAVNNPVELLVLQHPQEANEVKNTIRLLSLCAKNIQIKIGEAFSDTELYQLIYADQKIPLLLYPPTPEGESLGIQIAPELPDLSNLPIEQIRLVILDATWKKSRKMLYLNNEFHPVSMRSVKSITKTSCPVWKPVAMLGDNWNKLRKLTAIY
jgi:DTW domain-containing protein YfiP